MAKQLFIPRKFTPDSLELIPHVNSVLLEYEAQGYKLTLRQLYYQLVARDLLPERWRDPKTGSKNNFRAYKNLGSLVSDARNAGLIDWDRMEDRGRQVSNPAHWSSPKSILEACAGAFAIDKWLEQPYYVLVMCEKDALTGVLEPACQSLDIGYSANKGYSSSSAMYEIGKVLRYWRLQKNKQLRVIYLGDLDPSGVNMTEDVAKRLSLYSRLSDIDVVRIALTMDQVEEYDPPINPVKETDSRAGAYIEEYGEDCWELDALEPPVLARLIEEAVLEVRDEELWDKAVKHEAHYRAQLAEIAEDYEDVEEEDEDGEKD